MEELSRSYSFSVVMNWAKYQIWIFVVLFLKELFENINTAPETGGSPNKNSEPKTNATEHQTE